MTSEELEAKKEELRRLIETSFPKKEPVEPDPRDNMKPDELAKYGQYLKDKQALEELMRTRNARF